MKKVLYLIALLAFTNGLQAQYFQHLYGVPTDEAMTSGVNTIAQGPGHFFAGLNGGPTLGVPAITVTFTDRRGNIPGAPYFNTNFAVVSNAGNLLATQDPQVFELDNGAGFGVVGRYIDFNNPSPNTGVFYLQLDPTGNPVAVYDYPPLAGANTYDVIEVAGIRESPSGNELYITGSVSSSYPQINAFALKVDVNSGILLWSQIYDIQNGTANAESHGKDIIESPYSIFGVTGAVLVGYVYNDVSIPSGTTADGFMLEVDAGTGLPIPGIPAFLHGGTFSWDYFNSIEISNNTTYGPVGYILGGNSDAAGSMDFWLQNTDAVGNNTWATLHDYSWNPGAYDECFDVIERLNTNGQWEYYACGYTNNGYFGGSDMVVLKTDDMGFGVVGGEFTYGARFGDFAKSIDQYNGTGFDGLSIFGTFDALPGGLGGSDLCLVKSYFNGVSGCNEIFNNPNPMGGPSLFYAVNAVNIDIFGSYNMLETNNPAKDLRMCFSRVLADGDNARIAPPEPKGDKQAIISPNPMLAGSNFANVSIESDQPVAVKIELYDMLGRVQYSNNYSLVKGTNNIPLDVSNAKLAAGMYSLRISSTSINKTILLRVE